MAEALSTVQVLSPNVKAEQNRIIQGLRTGKRFKAALRKNGLNVRRFAQISGLSSSYVYHVLSDYPKFPVTDDFIRIALSSPMTAHLGLGEDVFYAEAGPASA